MRIALLSDLHANLPFAEAAIRRARRHGCDRIIHLGDVVDLGPWPSETLDLLLGEGVELIRGNHDEYPTTGVPAEVGTRLGGEICDHMVWTAEQLRSDQRALLADLPLSRSAHIDEWQVRFQHFIIRDDRISDEFLGGDADDTLERFMVRHGEIVCFGHIHDRFWHFTGERGILNPGATGFEGPDGGWFAVLCLRERSAWVEWHPVESTASVVVTELERRRVPAWESSVSYMFAPAAS